MGAGKREMVLNEQLRKAAQRDPVNQALTVLKNGTLGAIENAQNWFGRVQNVAEQNQLDKIKNIFQANPFMAGAAAYQLSTNIERRKREEEERKQKQQIRRLEERGEVTPLADKDRIVNNFAAREAASLKAVRPKLDKYGEEAVKAYEKHLTSLDFTPDEVAQYASEAKKQVQAKNAELLGGEAANSRQGIAEITGGNLDGINKFRLGRQLNKLDEAATGRSKVLENTKLAAAEALGAGLGFSENVGGTALKEIGGLLSLPQALKLVADKGRLNTVRSAFQVNPAAAGSEAYRLQRSIEETKQNPFGKQLNELGDAFLEDEYAHKLNPAAKLVGQFIGGSAPYIAAELLTGGAAGLAAPMASRIKSPLLKRTIGAGVENIAEEAVVNPGRQLNEQGSISGGQFSKDVVTAGLAGGLVGAGIEGLIRAPNALSRLQIPGKKEKPVDKLAEVNNGEAAVRQDLQSQLEETRQAIQERLAEVQGERALLSERSQNRLKKLEAKEKALLVALQKYEPLQKEMTAKGLSARQKAQELAQQISANSDLRQVDHGSGSFVQEKPVDKLAEVNNGEAAVRQEDKLPEAPFVKVVAENVQPKLGTKKALDFDGSEGIRRTLGDYKAVDFQEIARNPSRLPLLADLSPKVSKVDSDVIEVIADLAKEKKTLENTLVDLSVALEKKLKQKGIRAEDYEYKGIRLFPAKGKDLRALNVKGQKILNRYERMLDHLGLGERIANSGSDSLNVQTNIGARSKAIVGVQNSVDDLAGQIIEAKGDLAKIQKQFDVAKAVFMQQTAPKLENGGRDHVWKNNKGDTAFHIARAKSTFKGEAADLLAARREQLKDRADTGRVIAGQYDTKLKSAHRLNSKGEAVSLNSRSKEFKAVYNELKSRLNTKTAERMSVERNGSFANVVNGVNNYIEQDLKKGVVDDAVINEAANGLRKLDKQFSFNPVTIPVVTSMVKRIAEGHGLADTIELAYNVFSLGDKLDAIFKNAKLKNFKDAAVNLITNSPKTIYQEILSVNTPNLQRQNEKFVMRMQTLEARKLLFEARLAARDGEMFGQALDLLEKRGIDEILDAEGNVRPEFENSKAADALAELADRKREMVELAEDYKDELIEQQEALQKKIEKLQKEDQQTPSVKRLLNELKSEKFAAEKSIIAVDNMLGSLKVIQGNSVLQALQGLAYKGALFYNPSSAFLNLFDYFQIRSAPELQSSKGMLRLKNAIPFLGDVDAALGQTLHQKLVKNKNSILHFLGADKRGSYYNVISNAALAKKAGTNPLAWIESAWRNVENSDPNKLISDFYHDVTVVASARSWLAENPQFKNFPNPITDFRDFEQIAPLAVKTSLMTKLSVDLGLIAGRGSKGADFALGGFGHSELGKAFLPFMKPVYRISNNLRRSAWDLLDGLNGFKKLNDGHYEWDFTKVNPDKAMRGLSSLIANVGGLYLTGGAAALVGTPVVGSILNFFIREFVEEDQREEFKDAFNKYSLANRKLLPAFGERLQLQNRNFGEKDSVVGMIMLRLKTLGQPLLADYINDIGRAVYKTQRYLAGEDTDKEKVKKEWLRLLPAGQLINKIDYLLNDKEKTIYTDDFFPRAIGKVKTKGDLRLFIGGGNEQIEDLKHFAHLKKQKKRGELSNRRPEQGTQRYPFKGLASAV